ncbi:MAG: carbamoyltransferase HypF [Bacteroidales bacterium]|nr:carbamoyltransferase HypF [Bacteroidales bacterium]
MELKAYKIHVKGLVQGVGFRPFVYRIAHQFGVKGTVENNNTGVYLCAEGESDQILNMVKALREKAPEAASITSVSMKEEPLRGFSDFEIVSSQSVSDEVTEISPDIAVCSACLEDMKRQKNRFNYPLINCTNCGPRFTIIRDLPYDRPQTTMASFTLCRECEAEYSQVQDRRFHAQPIACHHCGPHYTLHYDGLKVENIESVIHQTAALLDQNKIVAVKGMGGFHLACNAFSEDTVARLRRKKSREGKPFAVMFRNVEVTKKFMVLNEQEEAVLKSWRRPVVLLKSKKNLADSVSLGLDTVGVMLPYMPFHYLLFERLKTDCIVLTSGNIAEEPVLIDNEEALKKLAPVADAYVTYNRDIHNRADDSVCFVTNGAARLIRRSRSYAPSPVQIQYNTEGIFAAGAELVNCFAIGKGNQVLLSQHIGDLKNLETLEFYEESFERFQRLFRFKPKFIASDLHPDYLSTRFAEGLDIPLIRVQHHHAHIAACMAEHQLDERVIGISFDGTGLGTDGKIWGGEFLVADLNDFDRVVHFDYLPMPGGDLVTREPFRMAMALVHHYKGSDFLKDHRNSLFSDISQEKFDAVMMMLDRKINCPESDSAGRLFDAVAALTGVCRRSTFHAEAPMRLESVASMENEGDYNFDFDGVVLSFRPMTDALIQDVLNQVDPSVISAKFHRTILKIMLDVTKTISNQFAIKKVVLSGGSFQNRILLGLGEDRLRKAGFEVFSHESVPSNDGGIALGQMAVAAKRLSMNDKNK